MPLQPHMPEWVERADSLDHAMLREQVCQAGIQQPQWSAHGGVQHQRFLSAPLWGVMGQGVQRPQVE